MDERERLSALAAFVPVLEADDFVPGAWHKSEQRDDGVWTMPWYELGETSLAFLKAVGAGGWLMPGFDWPTWAKTPEAQALRFDPEALAKATPDQLSKLLTALVREDRFNEGALGDTFEAGVMLAIAKRAAVLADDLTGSGRVRAGGGRVDRIAGGRSRRDKCDDGECRGQPYPGHSAEPAVATGRAFHLRGDSLGCDRQIPMHASSSHRGPSSMVWDGRPEHHRLQECSNVRSWGRVRQAPG